MARTIVASDPTTGGRGLLIEVHANLDNVDDRKDAFCTRMFDTSMRVGMLVTPKDTVVVRDTLSSMERVTNRFSFDYVNTADLFAASKQKANEHISDEAGLTKRVLAWLRAVGHSWWDNLPQAAVAAMVPDVVGHLVGAELEDWEGVKNTNEADAAE